MSKQANPVGTQLSRITGIGWMARELHNTATGIYMSSPTKATYQEIISHLQTALTNIDAMSLDGWACPGGWCPDERDRCRPCDNDEDDRDHEA